MRKLTGTEVYFYLQLLTIKARLVDHDRKIIDSHELGFSERDRLNMVALMARTGHSLDSKRISDWANSSCTILTFGAVTQLARGHKVSARDRLLCNRSLSDRNVTVRSLYNMSPLGYYLNV